MSILTISSEILSLTWFYLKNFIIFMCIVCLFELLSRLSFVFLFHKLDILLWLLFYHKYLFRFTPTVYCFGSQVFLLIRHLASFFVFSKENTLGVVCFQTAFPVVQVSLVLAVLLRVNLSLWCCCTDLLSRGVETTGSTTTPGWKNRL